MVSIPIVLATKEVLGVELAVQTPISSSEQTEIVRKIVCPTIRGCFTEKTAGAAAAAAAAEGATAATVGKEEEEEH